MSSSLITFGGYDGKYLFNGLHKLNTITLHWNALRIRNPSEGPMPKKGCGLVSFQGGKLALIGEGEFHLFDVQEGMLFCCIVVYFSPIISHVPPPPPLQGYSMHAIQTVASRIMIHYVHVLWVN